MLIASERPGNGKSFAAKTWRFDPESQVLSIVMTEETSAADLRGYYISRGGDFEFLKGPCAVAMERGLRLVIDEVDQAGPDAMALLRCILDTPEHAALYLPTGEIIRPAPTFEVVATTNARPEDLPAPLRDRFTIVRVESPNPDLIAMLPFDLRELAEKMGRHSDLEQYVSLRAWFDFAGFRKSHDLSIDQAAALAFNGRAQEIIDTLKLSKSPYLPD